MARVWRIATDTPDYTADDLTGTGAKFSGGRWNRKGVPMVYASASIALACLETLVHLGPTPLPLNRYLVQIDIPEPVFEKRGIFEQLTTPARRVGWDAEPAGRVSLTLGSEWALSRASAILDIPSVIVAEERNYLINPAHPEAALITATKLRRFHYDDRLR